MQCPRKRGPRVGLVESLERRLQQMEKLLQPLKEQGIVVGEEDDVLIYFGKTSAKPGLIPKKETFCGDADDNDIMHTTTTNSSENSSESSGTSCYFRYIDNQMPLLHKSTFMSQLKQNKVSPFLIYSLCAVAAR
ncbi:3501_t:CDS:2 [Entrophospora sp. SA101]|nr:3501_t:CDS:2 [Entrophospora sp. SA101]